MIFAPNGIAFHACAFMKFPEELLQDDQGHLKIEKTMYADIPKVRKFFVLPFACYVPLVMAPAVGSVESRSNFERRTTH
jgi:hypothetical protein